MDTDAANRAGAVPSPDIRDALARVLASGAFARSGQLQRLLRFVVEETIAGRGDRLKEYVIGVEVFSRPAAFDPRLDSLVRVEARRLRAALEAYYQGDGRADPVVIDLQKGSYVPSFHRAAPPAAGGGGAGQVTALRRPISLLTALLWALAIVAVGVTVFVLFRSRGASALTERDVVVLTGFANSTGEAIFDDTLKQGLTSALEQSPFLNILSDRRVSQALTFMGRSPSERVTGDAARELCVRTGSQAMVEGSIARLGTQYVIGLTATICATGDAIAHAQAQAAGREAVLKALNDAAAQLRGRLGESLASIRRYDAPIEEATTASLEALQAYSLGQRTAREQGSPADIPFYERAIEIDPNFAAAHAALGVSYVNLGQPSAGAACLERAYRLRDRVSTREKFRISAYYLHVVTGELDRANEEYRLWRQSYPRDLTPRINLGLIDTWLGQYERALGEMNEAIGLDPGNVLSYSNAAALSIKLERPEQARATLQQALSRRLTSRFVRSISCYLAFLDGDDGVMARQLAEVRDKPRDEEALLSIESDTEACRGRLAAARELSGRAIDSALRAGAKEAAAGWLAGAALRDAEFGQPGEARREIARAIDLAPGRDVLALVALASARAGDAGQAERLLGDLEKAHPLNTTIRVYWAPAIAAAIALARGDAARAIEDLKTAAPYELGSPPPIGLATLYPVYLRGQAYLRMGDGAAAGGEFQKILDHPGLVLNFPLGALASLQLGRARTLSRDVPGARQAYGRFLERWKQADPGVPVLQAAKAEARRLR